MKVEDFQLLAVNNLVRDLVKEVVVWEGKLLELRQLSYTRREKPGEAMRVQDDSGDSERVRIV